MNPFFIQHTKIHFYFQYFHRYLWLAAIGTRNVHFFVCLVTYRVYTDLLRKIFRIIVLKSSIFFGKDFFYYIRSNKYKTEVIERAHSYIMSKFEPPIIKSNEMTAVLIWQALKPRFQFFTNQVWSALNREFLSYFVAISIK